MQSAQTELDFINLYLEALSTKSVRYGQDYKSRSLPCPLRIKRVPAGPILEEKAPETPRAIQATESKLQVTVKVLKPSSQFSIGGLNDNDTVGQLKQRIYQQQSSLPVNRQRLLIKGKVLADQKSLGELSIQEGTIIHLMVTAAPSSPAATNTTTTGRFGVSAEGEQKMASSGFWEALEKTIIEQLGEADAKLVFSKVKASLS